MGFNSGDANIGVPTLVVKIKSFNLLIVAKSKSANL